MRIANRNAREFTDRLQPFKGSNLHAERRGNGDYVVYSYGWYPIFVYTAFLCRWYENENGYSQTTKRHISQSRPSDPIIIKASKGFLDLCLDGRAAFRGQGTFVY